MDCDITFSSRFSYRANGETGAHVHDQDWQIHLIHGGGASVTVNHTRYTVKEGSILLIPPGASHRFQAGKEGMEALEVKFSTKEEELLSLLSGIAPHFPAKDNQLFNLLSRIIDESLSQEPGWEILSDGLLKESLVVMARYQAPEQEEHTSPAIKAATLYINQHLGSNFSVEDLANGCGYNQDYLYRTIKHAYGISAIQYVNQIRFERAKQLIEHTDLSLSEIAWNLGFESIQYFSKFFRQHEGTSPSEYCDKVRI